jgi:hypothetical protein
MQSAPSIFNPLWKLYYPLFRSPPTHRPADEGEDQDVFTDIFRRNAWSSEESRSGMGSTLLYTAPLRKALPGLFARLGVKTLLDAPCGDFNWMRKVPLDGIDYTGGDIVEELIEGVENRYGGPGRRFRLLNIINDPLPSADLWMCRDVLFHLPERDILTILRRFARSDIPYLLTSTYTLPSQNGDVNVGGFRCVNLQLAPFRLPRPSLYIDDFIVPWPPRYLALWSRQQVAEVLG